MLQTSPMRLDPEAFAGTMDRENLSLLHGCLLREVTLGPLGPFYCYREGVA